VRVADEEEDEAPAVHADGHSQRDAAGACLDRPDLAKRGAHSGGGAHGPDLMGISLEEHKERVPPELEQPAVVRVGEREQAGEDAPDRVGDLLCTDLPEPAETFGHPGEAGDIHEDDRSVQLAHRGIGRLGEPADNEVR
jgi:hypothetical protein